MDERWMVWEIRMGGSSARERAPCEAFIILLCLPKVLHAFSYMRGCAIRRCVSAFFLCIIVIGQTLYHSIAWQKHVRVWVVVELDIQRQMEVMREGGSQGVR